MLKIKLPDGSVREYDRSVRPIDVAAEIGAGLAKATLGAVVDGEITGCDTQLNESDEVTLRLLTKKDPESLSIMRHSAAHLMARAVMRLYPGVQLAFGPTVENGFYYDLWTETPLSEEDFPKIEAEMTRLIKADEAFERLEYPKNEAVELCREMGQTLKVEHLNEGLGEQEIVSFYRQGEFLDLCRGPHIPSPKAIGAFKLLSIAGAYWKGDASRQQLQRLYATAFFDKKELEDYLFQLEEAKKRDHRVLGKRHELFMIDSKVGQGLILWLPKGAMLRRQLENFIYDELIKRGYTPVNTPPIGRVELYETSGHYPYYADSQFPPIEMQDGDRFLLRPMNCPHHVMIYKAEQHSYRDLPLRLAEFGNVYRYEQSGELSGLTRVRGFTQDDAHIFLTPEQLDAEFKDTVNLVLFVFRTLGLNDYRVRVSVREEGSDKYIGDPKNWEISQNAIIKAVTDIGMDYEIGVGEAAFYGPKLDFLVKDSIGREWQLGTIQVDYNLPERFDIDYIGEDGEKHRPVMIHRAPFGSLERFFGLLIEHFAGAFPVWMAPVQVAIIPISERHNEYAQEIADMLKKAGLRAKFDDRNESMKYKIRAAQMEKIPYMLILGDKEMEERSVGLRSRVEGDLGAVSLDELVKKLSSEAEIPSSD